jgi:ketosteroid isomerase-like protein
MSQENADIIKRHYEALNRGDIAVMLDALAPDCQWWDRRDDPDATVHRGPAALLARMSEINAVWEELRIEPQEFIDTDEFVVVPIRAVGLGRGSGVGVEFDEVHVYRLRNDKIIELREYREKAEALKAVGLEE